LQLGFVLDQSQCIGCHACTVACKAENDVPVGNYRTWVKYTEEGEFPEVRRSFSVLRCNQCTDAPCVTICPTSALVKRSDGIVDVDPKACIGCKSCMQGCPYDALYINPDKGTAEKCHFCAHRTERGLAPACAVVCPTEAIIPGDFDDPESRVSQMKREFDLVGRKTEAGTGPNVLYRDAATHGIDPLETATSGGMIWAKHATVPKIDHEVLAMLDEQAVARTVYDVPRAPLWGGMITGYLFIKSIAAGVFAAALLAGAPSLDGIVAWLGLAFLAITGVLLIADLKRPERFYMIMLRPNWSSWLARGSFLIAGYGALLSAWAGLGFLGMASSPGIRWGLGIPTAILGLLTAAYTGWLFAQAKGRVLWMKRGYWFQLVVQAALAGSAALLIAGALGAQVGEARVLMGTLLVALLLEALIGRMEPRLAPRGREREYRRVVRYANAGALGRLRHWGGEGIGIVLPAVLLLVAQSVVSDDATQASVAALASGLALIGLWISEDCFVRAGQALPIS